MLWLSLGIGGVLLLAAVFLFARLQQNSARRGALLLQENFAHLQQQLDLQRRDFECSQEAKSALLRRAFSEEMQSSRRELSLELQANRREWNQGLQQLREGVQTKLDANLKQGFESFEKVQQHLKQAELQLLNLNTVGQSINDLNNLLKLPHLRGNFGEAVLERLLSDMLPADGYELQYRIVPGSLERVDAVIKYPKCVLPIDSKFPREQVLALFAEGDPAALELARKTLYDVMKGLARQIKEKYIRPEHGTTEMALLFVPSETLYFEVLRNVKLCEDLQKQKVFMVSPNTLSVTLHAVAISRNYYEMAKGVEKTLGDVKKAQQHYENFERRFDDVGSALGKAQTAFNTASTHLSRYSGAVSRLTGLESEPPVTVALTEPLLS